MTWVVIWILFGIVSGIVGTNKGRSGYGWFAVGALLGPLGLILALVVPSEKKVLEERVVQAGEMKKCPYCAELIRAEAIKCRYCGEAQGGAYAEEDGDSLSTADEPASTINGRRAKVRWQQVKVRISPGGASGVIGRLPHGTSVVVGEESSDWARVVAPNVPIGKGWVPLEALEEE